jgi:hypothetical protein
MQLQRGVQRAGLAMDVKHVVELVDEAYRLAPSPSAPSERAGLTPSRSGKGPG